MSHSLISAVYSILDLLTGTFMVRQLQPWYENIGKRQVKAPKIYLRDSGVLHSLLSLPSLHVLTSHPRVGAPWEGFALDDLALDHLWIIYPGPHAYPVHERITVWPLREVAALPDRLA